MYTTGQSIHPAYTVFGAAFVEEHHDDDRHSGLWPKETRKRDFGKLLRSLRSALNICQPESQSHD
jgi:hypothetical protein